MKLTVFALLSLVVSATAAAAPVISFQGAEAVVTLPAGHRVLWTSRENFYNGAAIVADSDGDGEVRFTPPSTKVAVFDLETAEWATSGMAGRVTIEGESAAISRARGAAGEEMSVIWQARNIIWLRPGVGAWKAPAKWTSLASINRPRSEPMILADMATCVPVAGSTDTPATVEVGDWIIELPDSSSVSINQIDTELDFPYAGRFYFDSQSSDDAEGSERMLSVVRIGGLDGSVTISCVYGSGGVGAGVNYVPFEPQTVTFGPGEFVKQCGPYKFLDDGVYTDWNPTFQVQLTLPSAGHYDYYSHVHTFHIIDDDPVPVLSFGDLPATVLEGDATWSLDVPFSVSGKFSGLIETRLTQHLYPNALLSPTETSKTLPLEIHANDLPDSDREITVQLIPTSSESRIQPITRKITVIDDDQPQLTMTDTSGIESTGKVVWKVSSDLSPSSPATITWTTVDGTAKAGQDYQAASSTTQVGASITLTLLDDSTDEGLETFYIDVTAFTGPIQTPSRTRYEITIVDDDAAPPTVTLTPMTEPEPPIIGATDLTIPVQLTTAMSSVVRVTVAPGGGNATPDVDYRSFSTTLTFLPGETIKNVPIQLLGDLRDEPDETIVIVAQDNAKRTLGATTLTIVDDDDTAVISVADVQVTEKTGSNTTATFTVTLSAPLRVECSVQYETLDGSAKRLSDFTPKSGLITFAPGEMTKQVSVEVLGDAAAEADEQFVLHLYNLASYKNWLSLAFERDRAYGTIVDDDATVPIPIVMIDDITVTETDGVSEAQFVLKLTRTAEVPGSLMYQTVPLSAKAPEDFTEVLSSVTFQPGDRSAVITVPIAGDQNHEDAEEFVLWIRVANQLTVNDTEARCTIVDDDAERTKRRSARH